MAGNQEIKNINQYAKDNLTDEEKQFVAKINTIVNDFVNEKTKEFISFNDLITLRILWQKYHYLKPFQFRFDPSKSDKISRVFENKIAFIIWTVWGSWHLIAYDDDIVNGSLEAAAIIAKSEKPFSQDVKLKAVQEFLRYYGERLGDTEKIALDFWEKEIFPFLEGKREFKWEIQKND